MKFFDGRDTRFKRLIDPKDIMDEHRLKLTEVLPKWARDRWYLIWIRWSFRYFLVWLFPLIVGLVVAVLIREPVRIELVIGSLFAVLSVSVCLGGFSMLISRRWTWRTKEIAIRTLAQRGYCPNCGYIIRDTPAESDGCTPCSECGHAWRVEPTDF